LTTRSDTTTIARRKRDNPAIPHLSQAPLSRSLTVSSNDFPSLPKFPAETALPAPEPRRPWGRGIKQAVALAGAGIFLLLATGVVALAWPRTPGKQQASQPSLAAKTTGIPPLAVNTPGVVPADQARVQDHEHVVGVTVAGKHRAYLLRALSGGPMVHVVNDVVADVPVSITGCDRNGCLKAFTGTQRNSPLCIAFGGYRYGRIFLRVGDNLYDQTSLLPALPHLPGFPYTELEVERTTWKEWRTAHADTDVYVGGVKPTEVPKP
jgi:hypothetical protein